MKIIQFQSKNITIDLYIHILRISSETLLNQTKKFGQFNLTGLMWFD